MISDALVTGVKDLDAVILPCLFHAACSPVLEYTVHQLHNCCPPQIQTYHIDAAVYHPDIRSQGLSNHLLIAAQDAWMQKLQGQSLTPFHKEVHEALKQAGTRCRLNVALGEHCGVWHCKG